LKRCDKELFYATEEEIDLEKMLNEPLPEIPHDIKLTGELVEVVLINKMSFLTMDVQGHWLAIEGVQPAIPENPSFLRKCC
jgi:transcription initiation factor TFIID subunit 6